MRWRGNTLHKAQMTVCDRKAPGAATPGLRQLEASSRPWLSLRGSLCPAKESGDLADTCRVCGRPRPTIVVAHTFQGLSLSS